LRWLGSLLAVTGALALAFTPAFWSQTGGGGTLPATLVIALTIAAVIGTLAVSLSRRPYIALAVALVVFGVIFATQIGTARSLRFTVLASAWLIFLLTRALLLTNPRPDGPPPARLDAQNRAGIFLILALGVVNDPLFVLFLPAVVLALSQSRARIRWWHWAILAGVLALGIFGVVNEYYDPRWWAVTAERAVRLNGRDIPFLIASGWRNPARWMDLFNFITSQFTLIGLALGALGLARLTRWYPVLGVTTLLAYAAFFAFGLAYYGADRPVLLLPMLTLQGMWITYAVHTFSDWLEKTVAPANKAMVRQVAQVAYILLPALLLWNIAGSVA
ncbi:MAG TPA: hypothetical protein VHL11_00935, partial [Phototrophicaceae bacterium]|nr:hypothetical protein [Phototrophicaceae bacterium]